jgi:hypothetical protein
MDNKDIIEQEQSQFSGMPTKVTKTWFLERENGEVFAINEKGAWNLLYNQNRNNLYSHRYTIVGVSDGKTYVEMIKNSQGRKAEMERELASTQKDLSRYLGTLDRLKFDELLDDDDAKVLRAKELIEENEKKTETLEGKIANINKTIVQEAFDAELEKAKGNIEQPNNSDIATPSANGAKRNKILRSLGR